MNEKELEKEIDALAKELGFAGGAIAEDKETLKTYLLRFYKWGREDEKHGRQFCEGVR